MLRIEVLPKQILSDRNAYGSTPEGAQVRSVSPPARYVFANSGGIVQTVRNFYSCSIEVQFLAFSLRDEILWDDVLANRIVREIDYFSMIEREWLLLSAHGRDFQDREVAAAYFHYEPTITPSRDRHAIVGSSGLLYVLNLRVLRELPHLRIVISRLEDSINAMIMQGYLGGKASFFSSRLYPCCLGMQKLSIPTLSDTIHRSFSFMKLVKGVSSVTERSFVHIEGDILKVADSIKVVRPISFVVRTLFRRSHLLNRCLISIDYVRRTLLIPVEVVLASDVDPELAKEHVREIEGNFPGIKFVAADGKQEVGVSRVRNLKVGIKASTNDLVCIIDDDDYYLPDACPHFAQTQSIEYDRLLLLSAQIVNERWIKSEHKYERHVLSYGPAFLAENWRKTFGGYNQLPLCSIVYPGKFIRMLIDEFNFSYDLSEDFILHLMVFAHTRRPEIQITHGICIHQSHRAESDNVSNVIDRTNWALDTGNGAYDLLFQHEWQFDALADATGDPAGRSQGADEAIVAARRLAHALLPTAYATAPEVSSAKAPLTKARRLVKSVLSSRRRKSHTLGDME
jgi:hypothetical protein